ncbi:Fc.00g085090.m01.CDS01 [Cosmosporella sp. VM-42]
MKVQTSRRLRGRIDHRSPPHILEEVDSYTKGIYEATKRSRVRDVQNALEHDFDYVFVSKYSHDDEVVEELVNMTRDSLQNKLLHRIHARSVHARLSQILPRACKEAFDLIPRQDSVAATFSVAQDIIKFLSKETETILPPLFDFKLSEDAHFAGMEDMFATVLNKGMASFRRAGLLYGVSASVLSTGALVWTSIGGLFSSPMVLALAVFDPMSASNFKVPDISGFLTYTLALSRRPFFLMRFILSELALSILVHERMLWYGVPNATREMAARAWIEVLKLMPDVGHRVHEGLEFFSKNGWEGLLVDVVGAFRLGNIEDN